MTWPSGPDCTFLGDDFTGASDTLATFARAGWQTRLLLDAPGAEMCGGLRAIGVATALRSMRPAQMRAEIDRLMPSLLALRSPFFHYKVCSTFDSGPAVGSIGVAVGAIAAHLKPVLTIIVGGQPSLRRFCLFGNLFAAATDGSVYRIDRHPVMANHPVTPMMEADLRLHMGEQGLREIGLIASPALDQGSKALLEVFRKARPGAVLLVDALRQSHIDDIGKALQSLKSDGPILLVGSSSVAEALSSAAVDGSAKPGPFVGSPSKSGPIFLFAGSRSSVTASQVEAARHYHKFLVSPDILSDAPALVGLIDQARDLLIRGENVLAHLDAKANYSLAPDVLAQTSAALVTRMMEGIGLAGLGVAGGDTSSLIVRATGAHRLSYAGPLDQGVAVCYAEGINGGCSIPVLLKGGQMGKVDLFDRFATLLAAIASVEKDGT